MNSLRNFFSFDIFLFIVILFVTNKMSEGDKNKKMKKMIYKIFQISNEVFTIFRYSYINVKKSNY